MEYMMISCKRVLHDDVVYSSIKSLHIYQWEKPVSKTVCYHTSVGEKMDK